MKQELLRVGVITKAHGVRGEVKLFPTTDDPARYGALKRAVLSLRGTETETEVLGFKMAGGEPVLRFSAIPDRDAAEKWRGADVLVFREDAVPLGENENYIGDVIGLAVRTDDGRELGTVRDVMETGANDVYVVETGGKELLLPSIPSCILKVDPEEGYVLVHLLPGLEDL